MKVRELVVEAPDIDLRRVAFAAVNGQHDRMACGESDAVGVIEVVTGDVQVAIAAAGLEAVEGEQAEVRARDEGRELRGADFDVAAVRRDDERAATAGRSQHVDVVVLPANLAGFEVLRTMCTCPASLQPLRLAEQVKQVAVERGHDAEADRDSRSASAARACP